MIIKSEAFENNDKIPSKFACDGAGINPPFSFEEIPKNTKSLVLIMDDPDIPDFNKSRYGVEVWDHWVIFNIPPETERIAEDSIPNGIVGKNTDGENKYTPPCPPDREHRYFFKLYALDTVLDISPNSKAQDLMNAMEGHILEKAELIGKYNKKENV
jgi:Raf kinase inhibitor-like YbhB/YbcL family protein